MSGSSIAAGTGPFLAGHHCFMPASALSELHIACALTVFHGCCLVHVRARRPCSQAVYIGSCTVKGFANLSAFSG